MSFLTLIFVLIAATPISIIVWIFMNREQRKTDGRTKDGNALPNGMGR